MNRKQIEKIQDKFVEIIKSHGNDCARCSKHIENGSFALANQEQVWHPKCYDEKRKAEEQEEFENQV